MIKNMKKVYAGRCRGQLVLKCTVARLALLFLLFRHERFTCASLPNFTPDGRDVPRNMMNINQKSSSNPLLELLPVDLLLTAVLFVIRHHHVNPEILRPSRIPIEDRLVVSELSFHPKIPL